MVTPIFFYYLSIAKRINVLSLILLEIQKRKKSSNALQKSSLSDEHFFFLQLIDDQKITGVTIY